MFLKHLNTEFKDKSVTRYISTPTSIQYPRFIVLNQSLLAPCTTRLRSQDRAWLTHYAMLPYTMDSTDHKIKKKLIKKKPAKKLLAETRTKRKFASRGTCAHSCARNALLACDTGICSITVIGVLHKLNYFRCLRAWMWSYSGLHYN